MWTFVWMCYLVVKVEERLPSGSQAVHHQSSVAGKRGQTLEVVEKEQVLNVSVQ